MPKCVEMQAGIGATTSTVGCFSIVMERAELLRGGWAVPKACVPSVGKERLEKDRNEEEGPPLFRQHTQQQLDTWRLHS